LTIIFPKREIVPDIVTAGLETVAVRMSAHPVFREIVRTLNRPLAAPSANRFGRISPTTAQHVCDELRGRIPMIVDGGATEHGIESTIIQVENRIIKVLRRGPITDEMLSPFGEPREQSSSATISAPGQLPIHYAPRTKLIVVDDLQNLALPFLGRIGALCFSSVAPLAATKVSHDFATMRYLSKRGDLREAAANFFRMLRELDAENLDLIVAERVPGQGIGAAINDRLGRAVTN
jgi:L-threonylcarbamoyladenylate synthase